MATENSRIVTYLPPELAERLKQFCDETQTKTSEAIKQIVSEFFGKPQSSSTSAQDWEPRVAAIEKRLSLLDEFTQKISALESSFAGIQEQMNVPPSVPAQDISPAVVESAPETEPEPSNTSEETPKVTSQKKSKNGSVSKTSKTSEDTPEVTPQKKSKNGSVSKTSKTSEDIPEVASQKKSKNGSVSKTSKTSEDIPEVTSQKKSRNGSVSKTSKTSAATAKVTSQKKSKNGSVPETSKTSEGTSKTQSRKKSKDEPALETSETSDVTPVASPKVSTASQTCTVNELAKRLSVTKTTISRNKDRENFRSWSQGHDPEGVAWEFHPEEMLFYSLKE
ncbi:MULTISPECIES: hypothetical protein [Nostocales]|uniref:Uncharacterized protein n=3 Tax=Nostocales TaxID=1161 RepID=A0A0C1NFL7_9CYAN|nr:hypothetical protein [Tolypothrix bouteillei]KAF3884328.1 hypothetical protein DA73_0400001640 [Tolypothrix bouteillei VB521301]